MPRLEPTTPRPARRGFTLTELLVTITVLGIVMGVVMRLLDRQQRFYRNANEIIDGRSQLRQAASLLPSDLRGISSTGSDVQLMNPTSVQVLANFGSAVICDRRAGGALPSANQFDLPPLEGVKNTYTTWIRQPRAGDSLMVLDEGAKRGAEDDEWLRFAIAGVEQRTDACPTGLYTDAAEAGRVRYRVTVKLPGRSKGGLLGETNVAAVPATVLTGAGVRFERPVEYSLFQSTVDSRWYLGVKIFEDGKWSAREPVSGPYRPAAAGGVAGASGLTFRYYTDRGVELSATGDPTLVSRIDIMARTLGTDTRNVISRGKTGAFEDSLALRVAIRNRQ